MKSSKPAIILRIFLSIFSWSCRFILRIIVPIIMKLTNYVKKKLIRILRKRWRTTYYEYTPLWYFFLFEKICCYFIVVEFAWPNLHVLFKYLSILPSSTKHRWVFASLSGIQTVSFRIISPLRGVGTIHWAPCKLLIRWTSSFLFLKIIIGSSSWPILLLLFKVVIALILVKGIKATTVLSLPREFTGSLMWHLWHTIRWSW